MTAQEAEKRSWFRDRLPVPIGAVELTVGTSYTQGFGMLRGTTSLPSVSSAGVGVDLGIGARISRRLSLGAVGQYHQLLGPSGSIITDEPSVHGITVGIALTYHVDPAARVSPWVEVGACV